MTTKVTSDLATHKPSTGVTRDLQAVFEDMAVVTNYGAVMDGVTDCRAALMAAIATGKHVVIPSGKFLANLLVGDVQTFLDALYRLHLYSGQKSGAGISAADVVIYLPTGKHQRTTRVVVKGTNLGRLQLRGQPRISLTFVSATRTWNAIGDTDFFVTFVDASSVSIGDYLDCRDIVGTRTSTFHGVWKVTNVVGNIVTLKVTGYHNAFSPTFTSGDFQKITTVVEFSNTLGFQILGDWMSASNNDAGLIDLGIVAINPNAGQAGIYLERGAKQAGLRVAIHGFGAYGVQQLPNSLFECLALSCCANASHGIYTLSNSYFGMGGTTPSLVGISNGNALYGIAISNGSCAAITGSHASGNGRCGLYVDDNSTVTGNTMSITSNGINGASPVGGGVSILGASRVALDNSTVTINAAHGILFKESSTASLGAGTYNGNLGSSQLSLLDQYCSYYQVGATLGVVTGGAPLILTTSQANDFGSIAADSEATFTIPLVGVTITKCNVIVNSNVNTAGIYFDAYPSAPDVVTVRASNRTAAPIDPTNRTFYITATINP
jgi:hypothetical protein